MKYIIPAFLFHEEYIDDPHWNSGFWHTTFKFFDGIEFSVNDKRAGVTEEKLENLYLDHAFNKYWSRVMNDYKLEARLKFESGLELHDK